MGTNAHYPALNIVFLDSATFGEISLQHFHALGNVEVFESTSPSEIVERIRNAHVIVTNKVYVGQSEIDAAPQLGLICIAATGMNNVNVTYAASKNIEVKNVSGYSTPSVVQTTFALIFQLVSPLNAYHSRIIKGKYSESQHFTDHTYPFSELAGKTFGIVGLGSIGIAVAKVAHAFGMHVQYYSTSGNNNHPSIQRVELYQLLESSDIISIHAPLNEQTKHLFNAEHLKRMKSTAILVNTGRGGIVHELDAIEAIRTQQIGGLALDVFEKEPLPFDHPLMEIANHPRVVFTPHIAWASIESRKRLLNSVFKHIESYLLSKV